MRAAGRGTRCAAEFAARSVTFECADVRLAGLGIALATSGSKRRMKAVIDLLELGQWLDVAVCREDTPREKPAPDLFLAAASALGVEAGACLVIEDSSRGIAAARAAGMTVIGFMAYCGPTSLRVGADAYLATFKAVDLAQLRALWHGCAKL